MGKSKWWFVNHFEWLNVLYERPNKLTVQNIFILDRCNEIIRTAWLHLSFIVEYYQIPVWFLFDLFLDYKFYLVYKHVVSPLIIMNEHQSWLYIYMYIYTVKFINLANSKYCFKKECSIIFSGKNYPKREKYMYIYKIYVEWGRENSAFFNNLEAMCFIDHDPVSLHVFCWDFLDPTSMVCLVNVDLMQEYFLLKFHLKY